MEAVQGISGRYVVLSLANIDTDQIIPARFLAVTSRAGLGVHLFANWRYEKDGTPRPDFPLNDPANVGAQILVGGDNFGCGSSREHAPWALRDFGIRAVISTSIADIFATNCVKNGIVPIVVSSDAHRTLVDSRGGDASIDVVAKTLTTRELGTVDFQLDAFAHECLVKGVDELGFLLARGAEISAFERGRGAP